MSGNIAAAGPKAGFLELGGDVISGFIDAFCRRSPAFQFIRGEVEDVLTKAFLGRRSGIVRGVSRNGGEERKPQHDIRWPKE